VRGRLARWSLHFKVIKCTARSGSRLQRWKFVGDGGRVVIYAGPWPCVTLSLSALTWFSRPPTCWANAAGGVVNSVSASWAASCSMAPSSRAADASPSALLICPSLACRGGWLGGGA